MNEILVSDKNIQNKIYEIRGKQVMLDSDLAEFYKCKNGTKSINLAVKRHIDRFPSDFYFQLKNEEYNILKFQFETSSINNYGGVRKLPYAFTEHGIAMLASVIHTEVAADISVRIMRSFVVMRHYLDDNREIYHMGTSINSIGKKIFSIVKLEDNFVKVEFMKYIKNIIDN